ncbi:MAG: AMP-binding protein [Sedimenticola sp.]
MPLTLPEQPLYPETLLIDTGRAAHTLEKAGISPGTVLAVQSSDPARWLALWALARSADLPFMPLSPAMPAQQVETVLQRAGCAALVEMGTGDDPLPALVSGSTNTPVAANSPVRLIIHTSGSTGVPRGVMHTTKSIEAASRAACSRLDYGPGDLWLNCLAPWHIGGIAILERALHAKAGVLPMQGFNAARIWQALQQHPVSHLSLVPAMLSRLLEQAAGDPPPPHLRKVLIGGGPISTELFLKAQGRGWPLCVSYGLTEAGSQAATLCTPGDDWRAGDAGPALDGMEIRIDDSGIIKLRGPMVMAGYLNPTLTPGEGLSEDGWFSTGDLGRLDDSGHLHLLGRHDDVIVSGGINVHPATVEQVLNQHPDVDDVAVVGSPDPVYGEIVTAFVVGNARDESLNSWCLERLPSSHRPRRIISIDTLPLLGIGKIDRGRLSELATHS